MVDPAAHESIFQDVCSMSSPNDRFLLNSGFWYFVDLSLIDAVDVLFSGHTAWDPFKIQLICVCVNSFLSIRWLHVFFCCFCVFAWFFQCFPFDFLLICLFFEERHPGWAHLEGVFDWGPVAQKRRRINMINKTIIETPITSHQLDKHLQHLHITLYHGFMDFMSDDCIFVIGIIYGFHVKAPYLYKTTKKKTSCPWQWVDALRILSWFWGQRTRLLGPVAGCRC